MVCQFPLFTYSLVSPVYKRRGSREGVSSITLSHDVLADVVTGTGTPRLYAMQENNTLKAQWLEKLSVSVCSPNIRALSPMYS